MDFFHRRNRPSTEYSGHEEISDHLKARIKQIFDQFVGDDYNVPYRLVDRDVDYKVGQEFPGSTAASLLNKGGYSEIFSLVEIMLALAPDSLTIDKRNELLSDLVRAFRLSGSVYELKGHRIELKVPDDLAKRIARVEPILSPYGSAYKAFFTAIGDLLGRRSKPEDIVKDLFVGTEGYLKAMTGENDFGGAVKALAQKKVLNATQGAVMGRLYGYRSDSEGTAHAGNSPAPTETEALWFLETMLAQIAHIDRCVRNAKA